MNLDGAALSSVFTASDCVTHSLCASGRSIQSFILQSDIDRLNAMFRKARRWRITAVEYDMDLLSTLADSETMQKNSFRKSICLNHLLPKVRDV